MTRLLDHGRRMTAYVYILASKRNGTLYIGVTNNITRRSFEHRNQDMQSFTQRYGLRRLVYAEPYDDIREAIAREKQLKAWRRDWKIALIEAANPHWTDLYPSLNH